jgi:type I restriction enzyme M protein
LRFSHHGSTDCHCIKDGTPIDPCSGSGSLLLNIGRAVSKYIGDPDKIKYYAQELKANTYNLTRMNLVMRGILPDNIVTRNADTLEEDWPYFDDNDPVGTYEPLYVDAVVSNPPYSQRWDPENKENDPRFSRYGLAPKSKADYAFLLHDLFHLKPDGIMTIVLPHGVLFRGGEEGEIRKNLIEQNNIDAVIGLPANIFFGTGIPTIIMVLRQKRENTDVLIIDASKGFEKEGKNNKLRACDIRKIVDAVRDRKDVPKFSRVVSRDEIRNNDYNLNIPRYVDSSEEAESWDIYSSMFGGIPENEIDQLSDAWAEFPSLRDDLFDTKNGYSEIKVDDIKKAIMENGDVKKYLSRYADAFSDFGSTLSSVLIDGAKSISITKTEDDITEDIFRRFEKINLVDKYAAYEIFSTEYTKISGDIELIQREGIQAVRTVDPNMVVKKKNGKEQEVQDGWRGHILPFELVQETLLKDKTEALQKESDRVDEISSEYESIIGDLSEDDKIVISDALNNDNDAFKHSKVTSVLKSLKKFDPDENADLINVLEHVKELRKEENKLNSDLKKGGADLQMKTKARIENLSDDEMKQLLSEKWIKPVCSGINDLAEEMLDGLCRKVKEMSEKYKDTFADIENEIQATESELCGMMSQLTGSEADMAGIRELQKLFGGEL